MDLNQREAKNLVGQFSNEIKDTLERSEPVKLPVFGKFILRNKVSLPGRDPKIGKESLITTRRIVVLKPSFTFLRQIPKLAD